MINEIKKAENLCATYGIEFKCIVDNNTKTIEYTMKKDNVYLKGITTFEKIEHNVIKSMVTLYGLIGEKEGKEGLK